MRHRTIRFPRRFLGVLAVFSLLLATAIPPASAETSFVNGSAYVNVRSYGAKGDAVTDDTAAIRSAVSAASKGGKTVFFPAGLYKIMQSITVPAGVNLEGITSAANGPWQNLYDGESKGVMYNGKGSSSNYFDPEMNPGSWILAANGGGNVDAGATFQLQGNNRVSRIGFVNLFSPPLYEADITPQPPVIGADISKLTSTKGIIIEDISLSNPYYGIAIYQGSLKNYNTSSKLSGKSSGPVTIRNIMGAAMYRGISIIGANGQVTIDNIQFNYASYGTSYVSQHWNNCVDIDVAASTNVTISNVLSFGGYTGLQTSSAFSGSPVNLKAYSLNIEGERPIVMQASGNQDVSNSYLLLCHFGNTSVKKSWTSITIKQDASSSVKPVYSFTNMVLQNGLADPANPDLHMDVTTQGGATVNLTNGVVWNWNPTRDEPLIRYTHASGAASKFTVTNLLLCNDGTGLLATTGGSAYKAGELTFQYCRLPAAVLAGMNTGSGAPVKFVQCTKSTGENTLLSN